MNGLPPCHYTYTSYFCWCATNFFRVDQQSQQPRHEISLAVPGITQTLTQRSLSTGIYFPLEAPCVCPSMNLVCLHHGDRIRVCNMGMRSFFSSMCCTFCLPGDVRPSYWLPSSGRSGDSVQRRDYQERVLPVKEYVCLARFVAKLPRFSILVF